MFLATAVSNVSAKLDTKPLSELSIYCFTKGKESIGIVPNVVDFTFAGVELT